MSPQRYRNLADEIERTKARRVIEIGTCKGQRAELMIRAMLAHANPSEISYFGFDLFDTPPDGEITGDALPWSAEKVAERLRSLGVNVILVKGDSRVTLPSQNIEEIDLAFIDGGHSDETVNADFWNVLPLVRRGAPILLDDYWNHPKGGGCNRLVDGLDRGRFNVTLLDPVDAFAKPYGTLKTRMARVACR